MNWKNQYCPNDHSTQIMYVYNIIRQISMTLLENEMANNKFNMET